MSSTKTVELDLDYQDWLEQVVTAEIAMGPASFSHTPLPDRWYRGLYEEGKTPQQATDSTAAYLRAHGEGRS